MGYMLEVKFYEKIDDAIDRKLKKAKNYEHYLNTNQIASPKIITPK